MKHTYHLAKNIMIGQYLIYFKFGNLKVLCVHVFISNKYWYHQQNVAHIFIFMYLMISKNYLFLVASVAKTRLHGPQHL